MTNFWFDRLKAKYPHQYSVKKTGGFPDDDMNALQQLADSGCSLDSYYHWQFCQNEWLSLNHQIGLKTDFAPTKHPWLAPGTTTGTIYLGDKPVQVFIHKTDGSFVFQEKAECAQLQPTKIKAVDGKFLMDTGELILYWNEKPADCRVVISYEYEYSHEENCKWWGNPEPRA